MMDEEQCYYLTASVSHDKKKYDQEVPVEGWGGTSLNYPSHWTGVFHSMVTDDIFKISNLCLSADKADVSTILC